jgi:hypothetical protein
MWGDCFRMDYIYTYPETPGNAYTAYADQTRPVNSSKRDKRWNNPVTADASKDSKLQEIFNSMSECIQKCMLNRYGTAQEMVPQYCLLYKECRKIILKNMPDFPNCPPSMFSAAVHAHVMNEGRYADAKWCVVCGLFEYTCLELCAALKQREIQQQQVRQASSVHNDGWKSIYHMWTNKDDEHPHATIQKTNEKVHETHESVEELHEKIDELLALMKSQQQK